MRPLGPIIAHILVKFTAVILTPIVIKMEALVDDKSTPGGKSHWGTSH